MMNIEQLRQFDAIATHGSISAAADELRMPQSTLTRSIQRLERELGCELLTRAGRHTTLSEAGSLALEYIRPILREIRLMREALDRLEANHDSLRIGTVAPAPLWHLTSRIVERFPDIVLSSETVSQSTIERLLLDQSIDIAISLNPLRYPAFRSCHLMDENLYVTLPVTHGLAHEDSVTFQQLDGESFLLVDDIGFWKPMCDAQLPHSRFLIMKDREVFRQMTHNPTVAHFSTDAPVFGSIVTDESHVTIPISDAIAHASFHLVVRADGCRDALAVFDHVSHA